MLEEHQIHLCLQETDLEVQEAILVEEQECGLHPYDGWDLSGELEEMHARVDRIKGEHDAKVRQLSQLVVEISSILVDLGMLPVWHIPQLPKSAQEVLMAAGLLLEHLQEAQASSANPWDLAQVGRCAHGFRLSALPSFAPSFF
jgi:hypothetical protein